MLLGVGFAPSVSHAKNEFLDSYYSLS
jgi:hypothetical protein